MKGLCEITNQTFIMFEPHLKSFVNIERKRITGVVGSCFDKILCSSLAKRKCTIIGNNQFGIKLENGILI